MYLRFLLERTQFCSGHNLVTSDAINCFGILNAISTGWGSGQRHCGRIEMRFSDRSRGRFRCFDVFSMFVVTEINKDFFAVIL